MLSSKAVPNIPAQISTFLGPFIPYKSGEVVFRSFHGAAANLKSFSVLVVFLLNMISRSTSSFSLFLKRKFAPWDRMPIWNNVKGGSDQPSLHMTLNHGLLSVNPAQKLNCGCGIIRPGPFFNHGLLDHATSGTPKTTKVWVAGKWK